MGLFSKSVESREIKSPLPDPAWSTEPTDEDAACCCPGGLCLCSLPGAGR